MKYTFIISKIIKKITQSVIMIEPDAISYLFFPKHIFRRETVALNRVEIFVRLSLVRVH